MKLTSILTILIYVILFSSPVIYPTSSGKVDLVKLQKEEKERRKKEKKSKYVVNNKTLKEVKDKDVSVTESSSQKSNDSSSSGKKPLRLNPKTEKREVEIESPRQAATRSANNPSKDDTMNQTDSSNSGSDKSSSEIAPGADGPNGEQEEAYWRNKSKELRARVKEFKVRLQEEESNLNLKTQTINNNPPDLYSDFVKLKNEIEKSKKLVEEFKTKLQQSEEKLEELYQVARSKNIPPGWLRD